MTFKNSNWILAALIIVFCSANVVFSKLASIEKKDTKWYEKVMQEVLRKANLSNINVAKDSEIRAWIFDKQATCYQIEKTTAGFKVHRIDEKGPKVKVRECNALDQEELSRLWSQLVKIGVFSLPDSSDLKGEIPVLDGFDVVIQFKNNKDVGEYHYSNPFFQPWPEAKKVLKIVKLVASGCR